MPDVHAVCRDLDQARSEFMRRFQLSQDVLEGIGFENKDYELGVRIVEDFYEDNKEFGKYCLVAALVNFGIGFMIACCVVAFYVSFFIGYIVFVLGLLGVAAGGGM